MADIGDTLTKVDFTDAEIVTDILPIENLFDYSWDVSDATEI